MENPFNKQFNRLNTIQQHIQYINYKSAQKYFLSRRRNNTVYIHRKTINAPLFKITVNEFVNKYQNLVTTISSYAALIGYANQHIYLITSYCDFTIGKNILGL